MLPYLKYFCILFAVALMGCGPKNHTQSQHQDTAADSSAHTHHAPGKANAHMHSRSTEQLIASFNNPKREAWQKPDLLISSLGNLSGRRVADLGAGSGYFTFRLARVAKQVIALEPNPDFIAYLETMSDSLELKNVEIRGIGYDSPGLSKGEFDDLLLVDVYHHIEDRVNYFRNFRHNLAADGRLWIVDFKDGKLPVGPAPDHKVPLSTVLAELQEAGYKTQLDTTLLPYQFIVTAQAGG